MQILFNQNQNGQMASPAVKRFLMPLILMAALLLRVQHIGQPYTDLAGWRQSSVAMMADNFYQRNPNIFFPEVSWNGPGESYNGREFQTVSYISSLLYRITGRHDWVGRLVAILFGVWGVFALFQLVRRVWDADRAFASAAVMAVLPAAVYFDRSFLPDPVMVSLVVTGLWLLVAHLQTGSNRFLFGGMFIACWGFLTKITGMITLLPLLYAGIVILVSRKQFTYKPVLKIIIPGLAAMGVVAAYYLWARYLSHHYPPYHFAGADNWLWDDGLRVWLQERFFWEKTTYIFKNWTLGWPFLLLFFAGIAISTLHSQSIKKVSDTDGKGAPYFFHFWLAGCIVFYIIGAKELVGNFWNFHIWSPMIAAFCGSALVFFFKFFSRKRLLGFACGFLVLTWVAFSNRRVLSNTFTDNYYKTDYRMGLRLRGLRQPRDLSVVLARETGSPIAIYYSGGRGWVFPPAGKEAWDKLPATDAACIKTLEGLRANGAGWFAIYGEQYNLIKTAYPGFAQYLNQNFRLRAAEADYVIFQLTPAK